MPLQVQGSDKTKFTGAWHYQSMVKVKNSYKIRREVHSSATAGTRQ